MVLDSMTLISDDLDPTEGQSRLDSYEIQILKAKNVPFMGNHL